MLFSSTQKQFSFSSQVFVLTFWSRIETARLKRVISNFMTSLPFYQTLLTHILPNISRSKGNQTMKFGQLIDCNIRNIFLEKSYTKCGGETSPRPFLKIEIEHISGSIV